jgi:hypothetical protein
MVKVIRPNKNQLRADKRKLARAAASEAKMMRNRQVVTGVKGGEVEFGPVTRLNTAPVAVGNSIRGVGSRVDTIRGGVRVTGRDYMFAGKYTDSIETWCLVGGTPLSPAAFGNSVLANYMRNYGKFRFRYFTAYYITNSPTSTSGSVMFYYGKNRESVFLNQTSSALLAVVLSDPNTVIGPQWVNHEINVSVTGDWKSTDYGMYADPSDFADGELFLLSKTSSTATPGYVLFDYVIEFADLQIQPRLLTFPMPRAQYFNTNLGQTAMAVITNQTTQTHRPVVVGNDLSGTAATLPTGIAVGDVYKVIIDLTNSSPASWTNCTSANLFYAGIGAAGWALTLQDGFTCYAVYYGANTFVFYSTINEAFSGGGGEIQYGLTATITFNLQCWISLVGSISSTNLIPNF